MLVQAMPYPASGGGGGSFGSHPYWMLEIDANNGDTGFTRLNSFVFKDAGGSVIATTGGTPFSSGSGSDSSAASNAFDGNNVTQWQRSSATNTKIGYQFASAVAPATIELTVDSTTQAPKTCRLRRSDDGITYTTVFEIWEPSWPASGTATRTWPQSFLGGKYKGLRFNTSANNGDTFLVFNTIEFRGSVGGADQCSGGISFATDNTVTPDAPSPVFDGNSTSHYDINTGTTPLPQSVGYYFPTPVLAAQYMFLSNSNNGRIARDFKLQGSTDGVTWTDLNSQTGITGTIPFTGTYTV